MQQYTPTDQRQAPAPPAMVSTNRAPQTSHQAPHDHTQRKGLKQPATPTAYNVPARTEQPQDSSPPAVVKTPTTADERTTDHPQQPQRERPPAIRQPAGHPARPQPPHRVTTERERQTDHRATRQPYKRPAEQTPATSTQQNTQSARQPAIQQQTSGQPAPQPYDGLSDEEDSRRNQGAPSPKIRRCRG